MNIPEAGNLPDNICAHCPAAYALGVHAANLDAASSEEMSASRLNIMKNESVIAKQALNRAAGMIACDKFEQSSINLPEEVPPLGSSQLIKLVSHCPSFPEYVHLRTKRPVAAIKIGMKIAELLPRKH